MRSAQTRGSVIAAGLLLVFTALSGCAAPAPEQTGSAPTPSPTATTPPPLADPAPRTPVDCGGVVSLAAVSTLLGGDAVLRPLPIRFPSDAAVVQAGVLRCSWSGPGSASLSVAVSPLDIWATAPQPHTPPCSADPGLGQCGLWTTSGSFYLEAVATLFADVNQADLTAAFSQVTTELLSSTAGDPLPAWHSPETGPGGYPACTGLDGADLVAALGAISAPTNPDSGDGHAGVYAAFASTGLAACAWELPADSFSVSYLPGGAWAIPVGGDPVDVAGADEATSVCDDFGCRIDARVGETWVSASFSAAGLATVIPYLPVEPVPAP